MNGVFIAGQHVGSKGYRHNDYRRRGVGRGNNRNPDVITDKCKAAIKEANEILSDGQWHYVSVIYKIAKKHKIIQGNLLYHLPLALSDDKLYFCIVNENTPDEPIRRNRGVDKKNK